jgi:hypothetical protein
MKREKGKEREASFDKEGRDKDSVGRPSLGTTTLGATPSHGSSSFFNVSSHPTASPEPPHILHPNGISSATFQSNGISVDDDKDATASRSNSPTTANRTNKGLPPIPRDFGAASPRPPSPMPSGAIDKEVFESLGNSTLSVRFDINIVKVSASVC